MEQRSRRPSSVLDVASRTHKRSVVEENASSSRRASIAVTTLPRFTHSVIEHIRLFKVRDDTNLEGKTTMLNAIAGLQRLDGVLQLTMGMALSVQGGEYTHVMHGRYRDKASFAAYKVHHEYVKIVKTYMQPLAQDNIIVDWECTPYGPYLENIGAKCITLLKIKEGTSEADVRFLEDSIQHLPSKCPTVGQVSAGANFSPEHAKGFTYGILELFPSTEDEEEVFSSCEHIAWQYSKIKPIAESLILVDYHANPD